MVCFKTKISLFLVIMVQALPSCFCMEFKNIREELDPVVAQLNDDIQLMRLELDNRMNNIRRQHELLLLRPDCRSRDSFGPLQNDSFDQAIQSCCSLRPLFLGAGLCLSITSIVGVWAYYKNYCKS